MPKLLKLHLEHYRNLKSLDLDFEGASGKIVGANRIGKTNVLEAVSFLLTDKLFGSADIASLKPLDDTRAHVVVEGTFYTLQGEVTLRKEFYEKWVRSRGSSIEEMQGHVTEYYINGAKQARTKDFFEKLVEKFEMPGDLCGLDTYQLLTDPFYLAKNICGTKDWKLARKAIIDIVGDVTPEEIFLKVPDTKVAESDLERHQYDDGEAKKALKLEIDTAKKQIASNELLIAEYEKSEDVTPEALAEATDGEKSVMEQITALKAGNGSPYNSEVSALNGELYGLQKEYLKQVNKPIDHSKSEAARRKFQDLSDELANFQRAKASVLSDIERNDSELRTLRAELANIKNTLKGLKEQALAIVVEDTCPTCGQKLPAEEVEKTINRKKAALAEEYSEVYEKGKAKKAEIEKLEQAQSLLLSRDLDTEGAKVKNEYLEAKNAYEKAKEEERLNAPTVDPTIQERISKINTRLAEIRELEAKAQADVNEAIKVLDEKRDTHLAVLLRHREYEGNQTRIETLREDNRKLMVKQGEAEQKFYAIDLFIKTKLELLDEHMASKLGEVRFQLIKQNIKAGSYDEVCVPYVIDPKTGKSTKTLFPDGSMSEGIYTGVRIIKAIRYAKGWDPLPILFDQGGELDDESALRVSQEANSQILAVKVEGNGKTPTFIKF